jgi:predicted alpha/beta-hydrolase family hydrolase
MRAVTTAATLELDTPHGPARVHLHSPAGDAVGGRPAQPLSPSRDDLLGALVLGHGAGGGIGAPDLVAATKVALGLGLGVALVEQPYRVAGRRSPAPAHQLDAAWIAVIDALRAAVFEGVPIMTGGRSSGARVACRTAAVTRAAGVLCLAFPLQPPARKSGSAAPSRLGELEAVTVPVLVVQGEGDPFGVPPPGPRREVVRVRGNHSLRSDVPGLSAAIAAWLPGVLAATPRAGW